MVKIAFNSQLFQKHIDNITPKILDAIEKNESDDKCLEYLNNEKEIQNLLSANVSQLKLYIDFFANEFPSSIEKDSELNSILRDIFENEYINWSARTTYGAYTFVKELGLETCPYTFIVDSDNGKLRPEIDHFYPKSIYPFLAMSFYNLIPSCSICNHTKGNQVKKNLENPYELENETYMFTYRPTSIDFSMVEKEQYNFGSFEIKLTGNRDNVVLFKLQELYKQHKDIVLELLVKKAYYPESYIQELSKFGFGKDEIYRYLFSNYKQDEDLHKRPLSKLVRDIAEELGLLK